VNALLFEQRTDVVGLRGDVVCWSPETMIVAVTGVPATAAIE